jgi:hypothetical protein
MTNHFENEIKTLSAILQHLSQLQVVGPFQGMRLAQAHDGIVAVINQLKNKGVGPSEEEKANAQEITAADILAGLEAEKLGARNGNQQ